MELASFKASISQLSNDELLALLSDIRSGRRPVTDLSDLQQRVEKAPKAKKAASPKSIAAIGASLTPEQLARLIAGLEKS